MANSIASKNTDSTVARIDLMPTDTKGRKQFRVKLGELLTAGDSGIPGASDAMRPTDAQNIASLLQADPTKIPAIKVQNSNIGFIIGDGVHRWTAAVIQAQRAFKLSKTGKDVFEDEKVDISSLVQLRSALDADINKDEREAWVKKQSVVCEALDFKTHKEFLDFIMRANLSHGLPAGKKDRIKYALWLMADDPKLTLRKAAKLAQVSHVAIIKHKQAPIRVTEQLQSGQITAEQAEQEREKIAATQSEKEGRAFAKKFKSIYEEIKGRDISEAVLWVGDFFKNEDADMLAVMGKVFAETSKHLAKLNEAAKQQIASTTGFNEDDEDDDEEEYEYEDGDLEDDED